MINITKNTKKVKQLNKVRNQTENQIKALYLFDFLDFLCYLFTKNFKNGFPLSLSLRGEPKGDMHHADSK